MQTAVRRLFAREWSVLFLIAGLMSVLAVHAYWRRGRAEQALMTQDVQRITVEVCVEGAVKRPGTYQVAPGTCLRQVLRQAVLTADADRNRIDMHRLLLAPERIEVPKKMLKQSAQPVTLLPQLDMQVPATIW